MYRYTEKELAALSAQAEAKGVPGLLIEHEFVPDGAEDVEDQVSVIARRFSPQELAEWIDAPDTITVQRNACVTLVLSIDGVSPPVEGRGSIRWLGDLMDGALRSIVRASGRPFGVFEQSEVRTVRIGRRTQQEELGRLGIEPNRGLALREQYPDPGQLRAVRAGDAPVFVMRRLTLDEFADLGKAGAKHGAMLDALLDCIVEPAPIEARRALLERYPGLGLTCLPIMQEMRAQGAMLEKKGAPSGGAR